MINGAPAESEQLSSLLDKLQQLLKDGLVHETFSYREQGYKNEQTEELNQAGKLFQAEPNESRAITLQQKLDVMKARGKHFKFDEIGQLINKVLKRKLA